MSGFKSQYGWSVRLTLPVVPFLANKFFSWGVSANSVSWLSLVVFCVGLFFYFLSGDDYLFRFLAVLFFCFGTLLDVVDGFVARLSNSSGRAGAALDAGIDILRYNLFFAAVYFVAMPAGFVFYALIAYLVVVNLSFVKLFCNIIAGVPNRAVNSALESILPRGYLDFCKRNRLLYNPINLEDQLLLYIFVVGVLFSIELQMIVLCLIFRLAEFGFLFMSRFRN